MSPKTWKWLCIFVLWVQLSWEKYSRFILWHKMCKKNNKNTANYNSKPFVFTCWATVQGYVLLPTLILVFCWSLMSTEALRGQWGKVFFFVDTFSKSDLNWSPVFMTWELVNPFYFHFYLENVFSCIEKKKWKWWRKNLLFSNNLLYILSGWSL